MRYEKWTPPSSLIYEPRKIMWQKVPSEIEEMPDYTNDNTYDRLGFMNMEEMPERKDYRFYSKFYKKPSERESEGAFANYRAANNYSQIEKVADFYDEHHESAAAGLLAGGGLGYAGYKALEIGLRKKPALQAAIRASKLKKHLMASGALVGTLSSTLGSAIGPRSKRKEADITPHAYITDTGYSIVPEEVGPHDISHAFHFEHPIAKYMPAIGTAALGGASVLRDVIRKKKISPARALTMATIGSLVGSGIKVTGEDRYINPYRKQIIKKIEKKYKSAGDELNEYISETGAKVLPFSDVAPPDLKELYNIKHPIRKYAPTLGTLAGIGAYAALKKPVRYGQAAMAGVAGGSLGAIVNQVAQDIELHQYKKPYLKKINKEFKRGQ